MLHRQSGVALGEECGHMLSFVSGEGTGYAGVPPAHLLNSEEEEHLELA